jgi:hypothetical protein
MQAVLGVRTGGEGQNRTVDTTIFSRNLSNPPTRPDQSPREIPKESFAAPTLTGPDRSRVLDPTTRELRGNYGGRPAHVCPHCGETDLTERVGREWFCNVCGKTWSAPQAHEVPAGDAIDAPRDCGAADVA